MSQRQFDPVSLEIMWSRLIGITDDMWTTVLRTAVSTIIGAAQDFGCEILDASGSSLAHSNRSMPSFNVIMPYVVRNVIERFPTDDMAPGDVFITNDPWVCAGHLDDIALVTPIFHREHVVAFASSIGHATSVGGTLSFRTARDLYEEGLFIPLTRLYAGGEPNETAFRFIGENVRTPDMVLTDIEAQITANELGARRLREFLDEYQLADLAALAEAVQAQSERATQQAIAALPDGTYESDVLADGQDHPIHLCCQVEIKGDQIAIDFEGSDPQQPRGGINCTLSYTRAHTLYPMKCLLSPSVPANEGTYRPITVNAPEGSILNCRRPASVRSRPRTGWHLHALLFQALAPILPRGVQAGNGLMHAFNVYGQERDGSFYNAHFFAAGGRGASLGRDGVGRNCFPSSARNVPVEQFEIRAPVVVHHRELRPDSTGTGTWRGAFGQRMVFGTLPGHGAPVSFFVDPDRMCFPPLGLAGGENGPLAEIRVNDRSLTLEDLGEGQITLATADDRLEMWVPGGGGYGPPEERDPALVEADIRAGLITPARVPVPASGE
ncbi:MAG TPA: hydantoinase B/oxoprolinase family protein [Nitrolancea sp.]|nr:hydantoinase B/oxoprolinase family protein [Nitrolancea sp.]